MTIQEMVKQLEEWSKAYYRGNEIVDDVTFDTLEDELRRVDPTNPYFTKLRETVNPYGTKINHIYEFIGSIDKIHAISESKLIRNNKRIRISAKLDGSCLVVNFKHGRLESAVTRGDGKQGQDVTDHYIAISKKYQISVPRGFTGEIRGEVAFTNANWQKFKAMHPEAKAARNSGTGLINQKVVQPEEELLDFVAYDVIADNTYPQIPDYMITLQRLGYPTVPYIDIDTNQITDIFLADKFEEWKDIYPCDGLVFRVTTGTEILQHTAKTNGTDIYHYLKQLEAYKFQAEIKISDVRDVVWQLGRTGKLTPVLKIDPVELSGAVVTSITAHNAANVKELMLGKGAKIAAMRSGEVIPFIHSVIDPADSVVIPTHCPYCGSKLEYTPTGKDIVCTFEACEGKSKFRIYNFIEQMCTDVKGLGDAFLDAFVSELFGNDPVTTIADFILKCSEWSHYNKRFSMLGNADNRVAQQVLTIINSTQYDAEKFLLAMGVRLLGNEAAKKLAANEEAFRGILAHISIGDTAATRADIEKALPGQKALSQNILTDSQFAEVCELLVDTDTEFILSKSAEAIQYYAITGSLSKPRKAIEEEFKALGWEMTDNLNKAKVLITDDPTSNSSKNVKARTLNKEVLSEADFRAKYLN